MSVYNLRSKKRNCAIHGKTDVEKAFIVKRRFKNSMPNPPMGVDPKRFQPKVMCARTWSFQNQDIGIDGCTLEIREFKRQDEECAAMCKESELVPMRVCGRSKA